MRTIFNCPGSSIPTLGLKSVIVTLEFQTTAILDTSNPMAGQLTKIVMSGQFHILAMFYEYEDLCAFHGTESICQQTWGNLDV